MRTRPPHPHSPNGPWRALLIAALLALLNACSNLPAPGDHEPSSEGPRGSFERQHLALARQHAAQGHLGEAATSWEVLTVLRPDVPDYAEQLTQTRARIDRTAAEQARLARQAQQRGTWDEAMQRHLAVLALKPDDPTAAEALRAIERDHNKRDHLGKYARLTMASQAARGTASSKSDIEAANALSAERNDLEHAAMLAGQGEFADAIALLSQRLQAHPKDEAARQALAEVYFGKAQAKEASDKAAAIAALQACLQLSPKHAAATAKLAALKPPARPKAAKATKAAGAASRAISTP